MSVWVCAYTSIYVWPEICQFCILVASCPNIDQDVAKVCSLSKSDNIWLGGGRGDFNIPDIEWSIQTVKSYAIRSTVSGELLESCNESGLTQRVKEPTYNQGYVQML